MWCFLLIFILLFSSCSNNTCEYEPPSFPIEDGVTSFVLKNELLISYAYDLCVDDRYVYILSLTEGKWIQVYDKMTGDFIGRYVSLGQGPDEMSMGITMGMNTDEHSLSVYDQNQQKMLTFSVDESSNSSLLSLIDTQNFSTYNGVVRRAWWIKNGEYLVDGQLGLQDGKQKRFHYLSDTIMSSYNTFPLRSSDEEKLFISSNVCFSPSYKKMATGILYGGILETFELSDNRIDVIATQYFYKPEFIFQSGGIDTTEETVYGFSTLCATEESIYSVLIGSKDSEALDNISVFDWEGNPKARYQTDRLNFMLAVDPYIEDRLYALTFSRANGFSLAYYDLK